MTMLFDRAGRRKYLTIDEWRAFILAAGRAEPHLKSFCMVLAYTGARVSEVRSLTPQSIDLANKAIVIECLKRRRRGIYRSVPVSAELIALLEVTHNLSTIAEDTEGRTCKLWPWSRTTAWARVKSVCEQAKIPKVLAMPRALRHTFGVEGATRANIPLGTIKRWLGHARLESTIIYCEAVGAEERSLASRMWGDEPLRGPHF